MPLRPAADYHAALAKEFAGDHFTDPRVTIEDAAAYAGVNVRTLTRSLAIHGTQWGEIVRQLRLERALTLLEDTKYLIDDVARLSGYRSRSAFARAVEDATTLTPSEYRRAKKGPARAGGATGAFAKQKKPKRPGKAAGLDAVMDQQRKEAEQRVSTRNFLERFDDRFSIEEVVEEIYSPRRLRDEPQHWKERRRAFDAWVEENDSPAASNESDDPELWHK
jgi:AraC-like DNA-binding protein